MQNNESESKVADEKRNKLSFKIISYTSKILMKI